MGFRHRLARTVGKASFRLLRITGSGATTLPGLIATRIDRDFVRSAACDLKTVVITGTNGKTTTANQLAAIFRAANRPVIQNNSGSNLLRGIASTIIGQPTGTWGIFETDEADFRTVAEQIQPGIVIILNLFRDQMDRYGEINTTLKQWRHTLSKLPKTTVVLNADDPTLAELGIELRQTGHSVIFFGLTDPSCQTSEATPKAADAIVSPVDNLPLTYEVRYYSHIGIYHDSQNRFARPKVDAEITHVSLVGDAAAFTLTYQGVNYPLKTQLPGLYNVYNQAVAAIAGIIAGIEVTTITQSLAAFQSVFGRYEKIALPDGRTLVLVLVKNPVGYNQAISLLTRDNTPKTIFAALNDKLADGQDVSWIWDIDLESLVPVIDQVVAGGRRANELVLRFKYAGLPPERITAINHLATALKTVLAASSEPTIYCLLTYTAMLELHRHLADQSLTKPFYAGSTT